MGAWCSVVGWGTMLQAGRSRVKIPRRSLDFLSSESKHKPSKIPPTAFCCLLVSCLLYSSTTEVVCPSETSYFIELRSVTSQKIIFSVVLGRRTSNPTLIKFIPKEINSSEMFCSYCLLRHWSCFFKTACNMSSENLIAHKIYDVHNIHSKQFH
jgi:hypothetical protein